MILLGSKFWSSLESWIKTVMLEQEENVSPRDLDLFHITDDPEDVILHINDFYSSKDHQGELKPNYDMD